MTLIKKAVFSVLERFSDRKPAVTKLFRESEEFQTLCEDYLRCVKALRHWNQSLEEDAPARRREYAALLKELEEEIMQNLNESTACGDPV
jgi:hypothetical protein